MVVAIVYFTGWYNFFPEGTDYTGALMLGCLGIAMSFGFIVLLRNSKDL